MARAENIDVSRAQWKANSFHFFYGAAKACLVPFLSVYLRYLGLSALQTGVAIAVQAACLALSAPFWTRCAFGCGKKKFVLVFSMLLLIGSYLLVTIIPAISNTGACASSATPANVTAAGLTSSPDVSVHVTLQPDVDDVPARAGILTAADKSELSRFGINSDGKSEKQIFQEVREELGKMGIPNVGDLSDQQLAQALRDYFLGGAEAEESTSKQQHGKDEEEDGKQTGKHSNDEDSKQTGKHSNEDSKPTGNQGNEDSKQAGNHGNEDSKHTGNHGNGEDSKEKDRPAAEEREVTTTPGSADLGGMAYFNDKAGESVKTYMEDYHHLRAEDFMGMSEEEAKQYLLDVIQDDQDKAKQAEKHRGKRATGEGEKSDKKHKNNNNDDAVEEAAEQGGDDIADVGNDGNVTSSSTHAPDLFEKTVSAMRSLAAELGHLKKEVFLAVVLVLAAGAVLGGPVERLADSVWFEYLDGVDRLELYGGHRLSATLGGVVFPAVVGAAVAYTPCRLPLGAHHILLHFYSFTALAAPALILAFSFPLAAAGRKVQRSARLCKGLRILGGGPHQALFTLSAVVVGAAHGLMLTFMFWMLADKAGAAHAHAYMGGAVAIAALSEIVVRLFMKSLIRNLTNAGTVVLGLFVLSIRLVVYSFLWRPWVALLGEACHALSSTLVLASVETYQDFKLNPLAMDRSASAALGFLYQGVGVAVGAVTAGALYDVVGGPVLFQGAAVVTVLWTMVFAVLQRCCRKPSKLRYTKLLQEDNDDSDESEVAYEDDWLEVAMKHK